MSNKKIKKLKKNQNHLEWLIDQQENDIKELERKQKNAEIYFSILKMIAFFLIIYGLYKFFTGM